jgi:SOS-response transcriptional repressor LexA
MSAATKRPITLSKMPNGRIPNESQRRCLRVFARLSRQVNRTSAPTLEEISMALGLTSKYGCQSAMRGLEEKGLITSATLTKVKGVVTKHQRVTAAGERWL